MQYHAVSDITHVLPFELLPISAVSLSFDICLIYSFPGNNVVYVYVYHHFYLAVNDFAEHASALPSPSSTPTSIGDRKLCNAFLSRHNDAI